MAQEKFNEKLPQLKNSKFQEIGRSSNSIVFKWISTGEESSNFQNSRECYALKTVCHKKQGQCEEECDDLKNEHFFLKNLDHPFIVKVMNLFDNCKLFNDQYQVGCQMVMELALFDGIELINFSGEKKKPLDLVCVQNLFGQICKGVYYCHERGITHNDLKLDNFLIFKEDLDNKQFLVKIGDFGQATRDFEKQTLEQQVKKFDQRIQEYMAPELLNLLGHSQPSGIIQQDHCFKVVDERKTDIFSLGISLFKAVLWKFPFRHIASEQDKIYSNLFNRKIPEFWACFSKQMNRIEKNNPNHLVQQFQDLVQEMINPDIDSRLNIEQVLKHPFFKKQ